MKRGRLSAGLFSLATRYLAFPLVAFFIRRGLVICAAGIAALVLVGGLTLLLIGLCACPSLFLLA